jgi:hypothetical protein
MPVTTLFSYKVARDYGFAPNPFWGYCTLACCKPHIRKAAQIGDWVVGGGSAKNKLRHKVIFAMCVSEAMTFDEYWRDPRFQKKKPNIQNSSKYFFGDSIYREVVEGQSAIQSNSHHSHHDGTPNIANVERDVSVDRILISNDFIYFGQKAVSPPDHLAGFQGHPFPADCRDYYRNYPPQLLPKVTKWLREFPEWGVLGRPEAWRNPFK